MTPPAIFKAYDVRGPYPDALDERTAEAIGRAVAVHLRPERALVGHDMRGSSPPLASALIEGLTAQGVDVTFIGLASSPLVYFAGREFDAAIVVTASHNPLPDNGMKICARNALPIGGDSGLFEVRDLVAAGRFPAAARRGRVVEAAPRAAFVDASLAALEARRPFRVVVDAGNGVGGPDYAELMRRDTPLAIVPLYFEPDDSFPHHHPNPLDHETLNDLRRAVVAERADLGLALDGDADRCVFVDGTGEIVPADLATALMAQDVLAHRPGGKVLYDVRSSRAVAEEIERGGGVAVESRVGHAYMKRTLAAIGGVFGGELSGHYYFDPPSFAENTLRALFAVVNLLDRRGISLAEAVRPLRRYAQSGEINVRVPAVAPVLDRLAAAFPGGAVSRMDGLKVSFGDWWFNARPSNTEPLLRLVIEADDPATMARRTDEVLAVVRGSA
jgi:phosphomannomutase